MKVFTVEEANALLPTVREILKQLQGRHRKLVAFREESKKASEAAEQGGGGFADGPYYAAILTGLTESMGKLDAIGVQLKDFERGLIDFPSLRDGRIVLLCWQVGDGDRVEWWHDVDAGFAGRTRL